MKREAGFVIVKKKKNQRTKRSTGSLFIFEKKKTLPPHLLLFAKTADCKWLQGNDYNNDFALRGTVNGLKVAITIVIDKEVF
jgi:hypothetical protein